MASETVARLPDDHRSGEVIAGRYELKHKLGEGGMGVVWVARSLALDVDVALKMLRPEMAGTGAAGRMAREAHTAAQLGHPAMVRVLDFGSSERDEAFVAMELLRGEDLFDLLARERKIPAERAAALLLPIIDGLGTAHEKGIVHRDIKPENVFIAIDDQRRIQPKVLDFGIAKLDQELPSGLTLAGAVVGSPQYLSPEQAKGLSSIDFRSDIWSTGVLLYELVTGVAPFLADNYNALIRSILRDAPRPITELGVGDAQLWGIIARCLKKQPDERWGSMWELGEALALWLYERGVRVDAASRSLRTSWLESGVSGLKILIPSEPPAAPSLPPAALTANEELDTATPRRARTHVRARRRRWLPAALLAALAAAAVFGVWSLLATPKSQVRVPAAVPRAVVAPQPAAVVTGVVAPAAAVAAPVPPSALPPAAPPAAPATRRAAPAQKAAPKPGKLNTEFGF